MLEDQERYPEALAVALDALRMLKAAWHWWSQGNLENGVGWLYAHLGQYDQALVHCQRALSLHRESGYRGGTADTMDSLGYVYLRLGDIAQAKASYAKAIEAYREIGYDYDEAQSLAGPRHPRGRGRPRRGGEAWRGAVVMLGACPTRSPTRSGPGSMPSTPRPTPTARSPLPLASPTAGLAEAGHLTGAATAAR